VCHVYAGEKIELFLKIGPLAVIQSFRTSSGSLPIYSPRSAAPQLCSGPAKFSAKLFSEIVGGRLIGKTPAKVDHAFSHNSLPTMPCPNFSRPVKLQHPAA